MKHLTVAKTILLTLLLASALVLAACSSENPLENSFSLSDRSLDLMVGKTETLKINDLQSVGQGAYTVYWNSDNAAVATVDSTGAVVAKSIGTCKITAIVRMDGNEIQLTCDVTVSENTTTLSAIAFKASVYTLGSDQSLDLRDELVFSPEDAPQQQLVWSSSKTTIAMVSNGLVIPVAAGVTTIKVSTADGSIYASCTVQVSTKSVPATALTLDPPDLTISVGQTKVIKAVVAPADATGYSISWESAYPEIATVDGGVVYALQAGTTVVKATLTTAKGTMTAECLVTVEYSAIEVEATRVTLTPDTMTIPSNDLTEYAFEAKIEPANCTQIASWTTTRPDLITLDEKTGKFTLKENLTLTEDSVAVLITCTVGTKSAIAVLYIETPAAVLLVEPDEILLFDSEPKNTEKLTAYLETIDNPTTEVVWKSSNPEVATVDSEGNVTALKEGVCIISATYEKDGKLSVANCAVTVEKAPYLLLVEGETTPIPTELIPFTASKDPTRWYYDRTCFEIDVENLTIKPLRYVASMQRISVESADGTESASFDICIKAASGKTE